MKFKEMESKQRLEYLDSAKAIAIILVIVGHCYWLGSVPKLGNLIYSFHMPLFFVVSGFFLKHLSMADALKKYSKAYLWPYFVIGMLITIVGIAKSLTCHEQWYSLLSLNLTKIAWGSNCESDILFGNIPHIGPSWFLMALFWGCLLFTLLLKIQSRLQRVIVLLCGASVSLCSAKIMKMPMSVQGGVICVMYLYIGYCVALQGLKEEIFGIPNYLKILSILLWLLVAAFAPGMDIGSASLGYSIVGFTMSLIGTFTVLEICKHFRFKFGWIGRNTLNILCAHILLWRILDVFGYSSKNLSYLPQINFLIEVTYEISGALLLAWLISKLHILEFKKIFE